MLNSKNMTSNYQKIINSIGVMLLSVFVLVGCVNSKPPVTAGTGTSSMVQGDDFSKHLEVHNTELATKLFISDVKSRKSNDLLEINLTLTSRYKKSQNLQFHFNWFDEEGFIVEPAKTPWKTIKLHGQQSITLRGLAPNTKVNNFSVYVRDIPEKAYRY